MRIFLFMIAAASTAWIFSSCNSASGPALFCDTVCVNDTIKYRNNDHPLTPFVYISAANCGPDSIGRGYEGANTRKLAFKSLIDNPNVKINPSKVAAFAGDTSYAFIMLNDCVTGRGYTIKLPFAPNGSVTVLGSAINNLDPKFSVEEGLAAHSDRGNILVEDMTNGKTAMMTFGQIVEIDYDKVHNFVDSVNITRDRIWARVKLGKEWKELEKKVTFK
ncbi:MAG: hypothetical protein NVV59_11335 [Chitinophagaceae bacterium]|nr:hypothetical protein [Chitinophagaceae bacterium]